jgi:predicted transcriptional regulator
VTQPETTPHYIGGKWILQRRAMVRAILRVLGTLKLHQDDLARVTGYTVLSVEQALYQLRKQGLVRREGRGKYHRWEATQ